MVAQAVVVKKSSVRDLVDEINGLSKYYSIYFIPCSNNPELKNEAIDVVSIEDLRKYVEFADKLMDRVISYSIILEGCIDEEGKAYITDLGIKDEDDEW